MSRSFRLANPFGVTLGDSKMFSLVSGLRRAEGVAGSLEVCFALRCDPSKVAFTEASSRRLN